MASERKEVVPLRIDKVRGEKFHLWKFKMQMVLEEKDLWEIVSRAKIEPSGDGVAEAQQG